MPKKAVKAALRSALSQRAAEGAVRVVDRIPVEMPTERPFRLTQQLKGVLQRLAVPGRALVIDYRPSPALQLSGRNLPGVKVVDVSAVNVYDVMEHPTLVVSHEALIKLEERLLP
jgi:large subunit ribosomal protein L4